MKTIKDALFSDFYPSVLKSSLMDMMAWDATDHADLIDQPLLIIAGEIADSRYMSEEAFAKASKIQQFFTDRLK